MIEIKRGTLITPALLRSIIGRMFAKINTIDYSMLTLTTGQFIRQKSSNECDLLSVYSDQYFKTDIALDKYGGQDVSCLQKYINEIANIKKEI